MYSRNLFTKASARKTPRVHGNLLYHLFLLTSTYTLYFSGKSLLSGIKKDISDSC
ncbi:hypothetical protein EUBHAL_01143 [Anaerobutyricum hallii DSM 3353]|uniref:Uncharacterized protein n=1 Tax=Anaerobutyricum hallii DSM 3353 TaxID=411469 RepID=C0EUQ5_9FIRM|nr:hypothetical protein EUBHAL_01143 [Anaerobutyricum hallii DSM 3353]